MTPVNEVVSMLRQARSFIERGWTQRYYAVDEHGEKAWACGSDAARWCIRGAVIASAAEREDFTIRHKVYSYLVQGSGNEHEDSITSWNDDPNRTKEEVLAAFDRAIALAEVETP